MILGTLCAGKEDESYWKALAEERQSALNTSLEVNQDLREKFFNKSSEVKVLENEKEELIREQFLNGGASFLWSFGPLSALGSIESTTILTTYPS